MTDTTKRNTALRQILTDRRRAIEDEVQSRLRNRRTDHPNDGRDDLEHSEADIQSDISLALLQMSGDTLTRIDEALIRLDAGKYGSCFECGKEIAARRLNALPFAVRCQSCEGSREQIQGHARRLDQRRSGFSLFADSTGP